MSPLAAASLLILLLLGLLLLIVILAAIHLNRQLTKDQTHEYTIIDGRDEE